MKPNSQLRPSRRAAIRTFVGAAALATLSPAWSRAAAAAAPGRARIKIGQIGVGHAHATKLEVYRASPDYEVVGLVEPDNELRSRAGSQAAFRGVPWMTQEQLLNVPGLKAVLVETRVRDLLSTAEACVAAGMHIHLDKPAGESLPQFRRILDAAARGKLVVQMGYMYRYSPAVVLLRQFLRQGWLGDVFEIHAVMSKVVDAAGRRAFAEYRGGILFELGCHVLDLVIGVLGRPERVAGFKQHAAPAGNAGHAGNAGNAGNAAGIDDTLLDNMLAVLTYPRAIATVKSSAMEVEGFDRRHLVVCGTEGTFHIQPLDRPAARVSLSRSRDEYRKGTQDVKFPAYTRYVEDAADMARIIRGEKAPDFPYEHDFHVQETLLTACGLPLDR